MVLYHGTSRQYFDLMAESGFLKSPFLTDKLELAEYYAQCASDKSGDEDPVILAVTLDEADMALLRADFNSFEEPISITRNDFASNDSDWFEALEEGDEIWWPKSDSDYETSLRFTGSVILDKDVPFSMITELE